MRGNVLAGEPTAIHLVGASGDYLGQEVLWTTQTVPGQPPSVLWLSQIVDSNCIAEAFVVDGAEGRRVKIQLDSPLQDGNL